MTPVAIIIYDYCANDRFFGRREVSLLEIAHPQIARTVHSDW